MITFKESPENSDIDVFKNGFYVGRITKEFGILEFEPYESVRFDGNLIKALYLKFKELNNAKKG